MIDVTQLNRINKTATFIKWFSKLKDPRAVAMIQNRIDRLKLGNFGDHKSVGGGVFEMRIDTGKGYRVYYAQQGEKIYLLMNGGDKTTQQADIEKARAIWQALKGE